MDYKNRDAAECGCRPKPVCPECLSGSSCGETETLTDFINAKCHNACVYKKLAECAPDHECAACLRSLASEEECHSKNLQAAYFIITGEKYCPECHCPELCKCFCCELREAFGHERELTCEFASAAQKTKDACLAAVYSAISEADARHARELFRGIERCCTSCCRCVNKPRCGNCCGNNCCCENNCENNCGCGNNCGCNSGCGNNCGCNSGCGRC